MSEKECEFSFVEVGSSRWFLSKKQKSRFLIIFIPANRPNLKRNGFMLN
jgi:hypothetical protein